MPIEIIVPPLSQTMDTLILLEWHKQPGEAVQRGETLFSVETDKATQEVEAPASGTLYKVYAQPNEEVAVRSVIGTILAEGETPPESVEKQGKDSRLSSQEAKATKKTPSQEARTQKTGGERGRLFASPRARRLAAQNELDLSQAVPSGPRGMVVERDLQPLLKKKPSAKAVSLSSIRRVTSQRMLDSHLGTAPVTYMCEADASGLVAWRERLLEETNEGDMRLTYTDLLVYITCRALQKHPGLNATFKNGEYLVHEEINMGLAVDTDRGLIVPVLRGAQELDIAQIARARQRLVARARSGEISPEELSGGTFTISNLGSAGIDFFTPILNPPQVAILAIGRIRQVPLVVDGGVHVRHAVGLGATCDHRVIDGAPAARFLNEIQKMMIEAK